MLAYYIVTKFALRLGMNSPRNVLKTLAIYQFILTKKHLKW